MTRILEGTWAEIAAHEDEWNGRRLRVEIEETPVENGTSPNGNGEAPIGDGEKPTLLELMKDLVGTVSFEPDDLGANHKKYYAQAMDEKYPRGET